MKYKIFLLFALMTFSGIVSICMGHFRDWDFLNYHFYDGFAFFHDRLNIDFWPADGWSFFNPLLDAFNYGVITSVKSGVWASFLLGFLGGWGLFVFYEIVSLIFNSECFVNSRVTRIFFIFSSFILGALGPFVLKGMGSVENDLQSGSFILLGIYFLVKFWVLEEKSVAIKLRWLFFSGLAVGVGVALKLTNMTSFLALGIAILLSFKKGERWRSTLLFGVGASVGFLVLNGGWMWVLYEHFGSPLYPFYNTIFHSPDYPLINVKDPTYVAKSLWDILGRPFSYMNKTLVSEGIFADWRLGVLLILSVVYVFKTCILLPKETLKRHSLIYFLMIYIWAGYLIWILEFGIYRYAIPIEMLSGVLILLLCFEWFSSKIFSLIFKDWQKMLVIGFLVLLILWKSTVPEFFSPILGQPYLTVSSPGVFPLNSLVILTGEKQSFVIPFFQKSEVFMSTNLSMSSERKLDSTLAVNAVKAHTGPIFILFGKKTPHAPHDPESVLKLNGLIFNVDISSCRKIYTNEVFQPELSVCEAKLASGSLQKKKSAY
jgi:hypothetical protein